MLCERSNNPDVDYSVEAVSLAASSTNEWQDDAEYVNDSDKSDD